MVHIVALGTEKRNLKILFKINILSNLCKESYKNDHNKHGKIIYLEFSDKLHDNAHALYQDKHTHTCHYIRINLYKSIHKRWKYVMA